MHDDPMQPAQPCMLVQVNAEDTVMQGAEQAASSTVKAMQGSDNDRQQQDEDMQPEEAAPCEVKQNADHSMLPAEGNPDPEERSAAPSYTAADQETTSEGIVDATEPAEAPTLQKEQMVQDHLHGEQNADPADTGDEQQLEQTTPDEAADLDSSNLQSKDVCDHESVPMEEENAEGNELRPMGDATAPAIESPIMQVLI